MIERFLAHTAALEAQARACRAGTRRRSWAMAVVAYGVLGGMVSMVSASMLAVSFPAHTDSVRVYTDRVVGQHAGGYVDDQRIFGGGREPSVLVAIAEGRFDGLCILVTRDIPAFGRITGVLTGGSPVDGQISEETSTSPLRVRRVEIAASRVKADARHVSDVVLGQSADTLSAGPGVAHTGEPGGFGVSINDIDLTGIDLDSYAIKLAGSAELPDLDIALVRGEAGREDCA